MQTREQKIEKLTQLVNKFTKFINDYKKPSYNESDLRLEFLNPFFELLDWDVRNEENSHINYKDVVVEERINVYGSDNKKAPDYTFRIGGTKKFFVEAKKPSVDIKDAFEPAFQLKRYGHSAGLCLSILTDFEELSVYDTRKKPNKKDKPTKDRIFYYKYTDYIEKFDEIYNLFSKTAIKQGSFEQFEKDDKHRKGNESIDEGILDLVDNFREILAKNIVKNNENLDVPTLNKAVIKIIDRLFFLRIAEDKEVESYKTLFNITGQPDIYDNLKKIFKEADKRYNSELFKYFKDIDGLIIDDKILKEIIVNLYTPECIYEFSQIPVSILGSMYEQFLGKTIRITDGGHVKIEEKPEVKKAGGVYYTPEYIVNYIVKNTIGEKIKDLTPKEIEKIKILDPACGSGSFLIGAYQYLIDYHIDYYTKEKHLQKSKKDKLIRETKDGYILSIQEKQRILTNNIFGVDIDQQAVEVAKFSLLLKLMESESREIETRILSSGEIGYQGDFQQEGLVYNTIKILPNLSDNIKCGNSLIGTDYYKTINMELFEKDDYNKINAFDWDKEFPEIFKSGGFDCVIGNPPYVVLDMDNLFLDIYKNLYMSNVGGKTNLYKLFIEKSIFLAKQTGYISFIVPNNYISSSDSTSLRKIILEHTFIIEIVEYNEKDRVFKNVTQAVTTLILKKQINSLSNECIINCKKQGLMKGFQKDLLKNANCEFIFPNVVIKKMQNKNNILLNHYINGYQGEINVSIRKEFFISNSKSGFFPLLRGNSIIKYGLINFPVEYCPINIDNRKHWQKQRIAFQEVSNQQQSQRIKAVLIEKNILCGHTTNYCFSKDNSLDINILLALLNSKPVNYYFKYYNFTNHVPIGEVKKIPIPKIDLTNKKQKEQHDRIIELVEQMLEIQKQSHSAKTESDKQFYQKKADIIDKQIDTLVYELYGLTQEEIKIIESK
ncbi:hypothetical protein MASR1M68_05820 [Elusimicrobiota bacterium]